jgi:hypothetical protein
MSWKTEFWGACCLVSVFASLVFLRSAFGQEDATGALSPAPVIRDAFAGDGFTSTTLRDALEVTELAAPPEACDCPACRASACVDKGPTPIAPGKSCCNCKELNWSKYPQTVHPLARPRSFFLPPVTGPSYFSMWDCLTDDLRATPQKSGYAPLALNAWALYDAVWRYAESIDPRDRTLVERLKRMHLNDCWSLSTGGEFWSKYHNEHNSRLTQTQNNFTLDHVRLYMDLWYSDWLRIYGEYVWADRFGGALAPIPPDIDLGDIQDLFVDMKLFDYRNHPVYVGGGRQELYYGSQRMVGTQAWANKRNSYDVVKIFRQGENGTSTPSGCSL